MTDSPPMRHELEDAQAELADLRLALLRAQARLTILRESENHERVERARAERELAEQALAERNRAEAIQARAAFPSMVPPEPEPPFDPAPLYAGIAMQQAELEQLRLHLASFQDSAIWRGTWPLRRLLDRHPGLARSGRRLVRAGWWTLTWQWPARLDDRARWRRPRPSMAGIPHQAPTPEPPPEPAPTLEPEARFEPQHDPAPAPEPDLAPDLAPDLEHDLGLTLPTSARPAVSIIIPCFGHVPVTLRCLRAIARAQTETPFEVIVAEDASGDPDVAQLARVAGLRLLCNPVNLGFLHNCNEAALGARGRYLLFLNNDTEPLPGFLDALVAAAEAFPDAGLVGAKLLFPDGRLQEAGGIIWQDGTGWNYGRGEDPRLPQYDTLRDTDYVSGAAILLRRDLFEMLGGFDPLFAPAYYEDVDLAFRIRARGLRVIYQPASMVVHHEGVSHGTDPATGIKARQEINRHRLLARWPRLLAAEHFQPGQQVMRAAEHARDRPCILVIDHYVPEPDRDAGSRSTLAIVTALRRAGWVVRFWPHNRARNDYTVLLETMGVTVLDQRLPMDFDTWFAAEGWAFDHVLAMRPTVAPWFLTALLTRSTAKLSFYGVDLHHVRMRRQAALLDDAALMAEADVMERRERALWGVFDTVLYPSDAEAALVRDAMPGVRAHGIVPFCFDRFPSRTGVPATRTILFVAGFAHPPNIDAALWLVADILPRVRARVPDAILVLAGSHPTDAVRALAGDGIRVTGSLDQADLEAEYRVARAAIVPLRAGAGVKGKVVEALQQGLPLVTTPIGAEGIDGLEAIVTVSDDPDRLAEALADLLTDDRAWSLGSAAQIAFAAERFSAAAFAASLFAALG